MPPLRLPISGNGMKDHLVANVARCDRPVENWRHGICWRAAVKLSRCRERSMAGTTLRVCDTDGTACGIAEFDMLGRAPQLGDTRCAINLICMGCDRCNVL